jgi:hypothetical protein
MKYSKPRIDALGEAVSIIQGSKAGPQTDGMQTNVPPPAYELDE